MGLGVVSKQDFVLLSSDPDAVAPVVDIPNYNRECCFELLVLAQIDGTDDLKNDRSSKFFFFDAGYTDAVMILEKFVAGEWDAQVVLSDDGVGTLYDFGFEVNSKGENLMGYILDWKKVLENHGEGTYRINAVADTITGGEKSFTSFEYCLRTYTGYRADKTVRINFWQTGIMGDVDDDLKTKDFGSFIAFGQIRLPDSYFGNESSTYNDEYTRYQNGQMKWLKDEQEQFIELECRRLPNYIHQHLRSDILQADQIQITDFNSGNPNKNLINIYVRRNSGYEPVWHRRSNFASVKIKLIKEYKNHVHKRC